MIDDRNPHLTWLGLLGLCPLLVLSCDWRSGLTLGAATLFLCVVGGPAASLLRNRLADWSRWPALMLLSAIATGLAVTATRAFAYPAWTDTAPLLPLLAANALALSLYANCAAQRSRRAALGLCWAGGTAMAVLLVAVGALRSVLPADRLGATALLFAGLLLAARNRWSRAADDTESSPPPPPRRARVTGPVR